MHILLVTHYFAPNEGSSSDQYTRMARLLHERGHQVTVLTTMPHYPKGEIDPDYRGKLFDVQDRDGVRVIYSWLWATPSPKISRKLISQLSFMLTAMIRGLGIGRPHVALIEAQPIFTGLAGRFVCRLLRVPYVLNVSDLWPDHLLSVGAVSEDSTVYKIAREAMDSGYRGAAAITTMSPEWSRKVADYIGGDEANKIQFIYRGTDMQAFHPDVDTAAFRQTYHLGEKRLVTFIGTFATQYDFDIGLDIIAHFKARSDVSFVIIGTGSQRDKVQARIAQGDLPNLTLIDWLHHDEMPAAWAASTLNYWAMRDEPLYYGTIPAKIYEAFACGVPVVAAHGGVFADLLQTSEAGLAVAPGDADGLVAAIARVLDDDDLRAQLSRNARAFAETHFSFDAATQAYEAILKQVARPTP